MDWKNNMLKLYVNLDSRPDRNERMIKTCANVGLDVERFRGIPYTECDLNNPKVQVMKNRTPGAIGCHFSQISCIERGLKEGKDVMVLEDDLEIAWDFKERMELVEKFCNTHEWDIFFLGATFHCNPAVWHAQPHSPDLPDCKCTLNRDVECTDTPNILRTYAIWSTYGWIININSIPKILKMMDDNLHLSMGIDWLTMKLQPDLKTYCFVPGILKQYDSQSNIGNGVTYFSGFSRLGPYWYQDKASDFDPTTFDWAEAKI